MKDSEKSDMQNGHSRVTTGLIKSILKVHQKPPSEKTKVQFSCPSLDREKFSDNHPTLNVIEGGSQNWEKSVSPTYGERSASSDLCSPKKTTAKGLATHINDWMYLVDSGASFHKMERSLIDPKLTETPSELGWTLYRERFDGYRRASIHP